MQNEIDILYEKIKSLIDKKIKGKINISHKQWLSDNSKLAIKIKRATHAIKYINPDANGSSFYVEKLSPISSIPINVVSTSALGANRVDDMVYSSASYAGMADFLSLNHQGITLLERVICKDVILKEILLKFADSNMEEVESWIDCFLEAARVGSSNSSHCLAKQIYWPLGGCQYHILAPLFPTSLSHKLYKEVKNNTINYKNVVLQKIGGSKPINISLLNSERYGENYLLASCPPIWQQSALKLPVMVNSVFDRWLKHRKAIRELLDILKDFLRKVDDYNNINIRQTREELVDEITSEVLLFAAELQQYPAGWTAHDSCRLDAVEQYWLDPARALQDAEFAQARAVSAWQHEVCHRFARWLNHELGDLSVGDTEYQEWYSVLEQELRWES